MIRLFVSETLLTGTLITLDDARAHYLRHVMRLGDGDVMGAFNGENGEWEARVQTQGKRVVQLAIEKQISPARPCPDVSLAFAMIKNKSELVVEKATELGVREIHAIVTQHAVVKNVNIEKLQAHAIEAAEQCERFDVPSITQHKNLASFLGEFPAGRTLLYGDESGKGKPLTDVIPALCGDLGPLANPSPVALDPRSGAGMTILIGPEGGFSADEHRILQSAPFAVGFGMGPRILRADTAAVAALACVMSAVGDWQEAPHFKLSAS